MSAPSWVRYGNRHGWLWSGTVKAAALAGNDFWSKAARVVCAAEGGNVDMVQCYDAGIFTAGPLGATAAFGTLAKLLADIPENLLVTHLGAMFEERCLGFAGGTFRVGLRAATVDDLRRAFLGGTEDVTMWQATDPEAIIARRWVEAFAALLADPAALRGIAVASGKTLMGYLPVEARMLLPTVHNQATACFLAFAINNPRGAMRLLRAAGPDADRMLDVASQRGAWPDTFPQRVSRTRAALNAEQW